MYPDADIPVVQISVQPALGPRHHVALGRSLRKLSEEGVLIIGSGHMTHNLRDWARGAGRAGALRARVPGAGCSDKLEAQETARRLVDYRSRSPHGVRAHPTDEHFLPLFFALGAASGEGAGPSASTTPSTAACWRWTRTSSPSATIDAVPGVSFLLPIQFDLAAVFLFALTGVWAATKRGYDIVGAFTLAFVTGVGGGLLRDGIFLQEVPVMIRDGRFIWAVLAALVVGGLAQRLADRFQLLIAYVDAAAIGVYAVYGANKSLVGGASPEAAVLVGLCNAVGGGLLRDVLVREEPLLLKPGQLYVLATLVGCSSFVLASHHYGMDVELAAYAAIALTLLLRVLAIRFNWRTSAFGWRARR